MKKIFSTVILILLTVSFSSFVFAQKEKSKEDLFKDIVALSNTKKPEDAEKAYQLSKEYLTRFPKDKNAEKIRPFVKNYQKFLFGKGFDDKKYADIFSMGKQILADEPENVEITLNLAFAGYDAIVKTNDKSFTDESAKYAQLTLDLMGKGTLPSDYAPFKTKEDALAWMYYLIGFFTMDKDSKSAAANFYKSTLYDSAIKNTSQPYIAIAQYYEDIYDKRSKELNAKAKTLSDADFKTETDKINVIIEQMMDAYARAYKLGVAENNPSAPQWKTRLAAVYKFYKKTDAGFEPFLTYIVTTPFKDPSTF